MKILKELWNKNGRQFLKFGLVGLSNTLISYVTYAALVYISIHYQVANIVAFIISSLSGFLLNRSWVFQAKQSSFYKQIVKYYIVYGSSLLLSMGLSYVWVEVMHINVYLAPLLNLFITVPYNYLLNKVWAFRIQKTVIRAAIDVQGKSIE